MPSQVIGFLLVGRLAVFVLQKFPFHKIYLIGKLFQEGKFLEELFSCDLCLGVWAFAGLSVILKIDFIYDIFGVYMPVFNEFMTGAMASFVVHIFRIGWTTNFGITVIDDAIHK